MEVVVDLQKVVVTFRAIDDVERVIVRVEAPPTASPADEAAVHRLGDVLRATNVGELDRSTSRRAIVSPSAVAFHAAGQVGPDWEDRFDARCSEYEDRSGRPALEAVVVWPGERPQDAGPPAG